MVIFHSYVSLPEGNYKQQKKHNGQKKNRVSCFNNCFQGQKHLKKTQLHNMSIASQLHLW